MRFFEQWTFFFTFTHMFLNMMNNQIKWISIAVLGVIITLIILYVRSKQNSLFSEKIIVNVSTQLGKDLEVFFKPIGADFIEVVKLVEDVNINLENEISLKSSFYDFFVSHPVFSAVIYRENEKKEFVMYRDKGSYVYSIRSAISKEDSLYTWQRFKEPGKEISSWSEIININASRWTGGVVNPGKEANSISWNGEAQSQYTKIPVLEGTVFINKNTTVTLEIPVREVVFALTRYKWYKERKIFVETMDGDFIQIPALKNDTLILHNKDDLPGMALEDTVLYLIVKSLDMTEDADMGTLTFNLDDERWWVQTTNLYPVSYGIAIKENELLIGKIKQNLYFILAVFIVLSGFFILLYYRKRKKSFLTRGNTDNVDKNDFNLEELVKRNENKNLEFKSTLRWDLRENRVNPRLEEVALKTVAAFSNGDGGILIIGVDDNETVLGLESDFNSLKKFGADYFEIHLRNLLNTQFGISFTTNNITIDFPELSEHHTCVIQVKKGQEPVYVTLADKSGQKTERFYVRSGNSSQEIKSLSELNSYISKRFTS